MLTKEFAVVSERESAATLLAQRGYSHNGVARKLWISWHTVKNHWRSIFRKLRLRGGVVSRATLLRKPEIPHWETVLRKKMLLCRLSESAALPNLIRQNGATDEAGHTQPGEATPMDKTTILEFLEAPKK